MKGCGCKPKPKTWLDYSSGSILSLGDAFLNNHSEAVNPNPDITIYDMESYIYCSIVQSRMRLPTNPNDIITNANTVITLLLEILLLELNNSLIQFDMIPFLL